MARVYKQYDEDFKRMIVNLVNNGKSVSEVSREYGVALSNIRHWVKLFSKIEVEGQTFDKSELLKLKKEIASIKEENEILKKALTIFAKK
ncbi:IS3 family transposase [Fusobacterium ulcerans]|uniref:transposase n=1 Tax=Fusobacterium ulcerans TaxID=861 RepID=UPI0034BC6976